MLIDLSIVIGQVHLQNIVPISWLYEWHTGGVKLTTVPEAHPKVTYRDVGIYLAHSMT